MLAAVFFCQTNKFKTNGRYNFRKTNKQNRELISQKLADILNVDNDNGLMFGSYVALCGAICSRFVLRYDFIASSVSGNPKTVTVTT